jgi:hypothetical protein
MAPRVEIGWLVGYVSKNLYRIWFPQKGGQHRRIDVVRDAVFDENWRYRAGEKPYEEAVSTKEMGSLLPAVLIWDEARSDVSTQM